MKTSIKRPLIGVFGASVIFGGIAACSHRMHHGHGFAAMSDEDAAKTKARLVEKAASKLDLDAAQKAKLGVLADTLQAQRNALVGTSANPPAELQALIAGPTFDRAKAKSLVEEKTGAISDAAPAADRRRRAPWPAAGGVLCARRLRVAACHQAQRRAGAAAR